MTDQPLARLRKLCLALPAVTERLSHGEATWFVQGGKTVHAPGPADAR